MTLPTGTLPAGTLKSLYGHIKKMSIGRGRFGFSVIAVPDENQPVSGLPCDTSMKINRYWGFLAVPQ
jgi:hypothetical protein